MINNRKLDSDFYFIKSIKKKKSLNYLMSKSLLF